MVIRLPWHTPLLSNGIKNVKGMCQERINQITRLKLASNMQTDVAKTGRMVGHNKQQWRATADFLRPEVKHSWQDRQWKWSRN